MAKKKRRPPEARRTAGEARRSFDVPDFQGWNADELETVPDVFGPGTPADRDEPPAPRG